MTSGAWMILCAALSLDPGECFCPPADCEPFDCECDCEQSDRSNWLTSQDWSHYINPFAPMDIEREPRYVDPYGWQFLQVPYRLGWVKHDELNFLPAAETSGAATGSMQTTEFYSWLRYSYLAHPDVLVNLTGIWDGYYWSGPMQPNLPGQVDRLSLDMEAALLGHGPVNTTIGFHPQIVMDPEDHLTKNAFNFDGRIVNTHRLSDEWLLVYGVAFWDRVNVLVIPEVGAVWMPDDRWEFRLLFPRSQFSYRLGELNGGQTWITSVVEYVVQAYQVKMPGAGDDRIQLQDWRASVGLRQDYERISWEFDAGVVFDRNIKFRDDVSEFDIDPTGLLRFAFWF
ncbi:MAG: hypothetical protein U0872_06295 [Planctomycetaceae bacterium]